VENREEHRNPSGALTRLKLRRPAHAWHRRVATLWLQEDTPPDIERIVALLALDPLLCVSILKRANGSFYGLRGTIDSLTHAVDILGHGVVLGMIADTVSRTDSPDSSSEVSDILTRHSLATAYLAHWLDNRNQRSPGCAFTAGLLHDIGKHVFDLNFPEESGRIYGHTDIWKSLQGQDLRTVEQLSFCLDHLEIGEFIARKMHFPETLISTLIHHDRPESVPPYDRVHRMCWIVNAASLGATALGYAAGVSVSWEQCARDERWNTLLSEGIVPETDRQRMLDDMQLLDITIREALEPWEQRNIRRTDRKSVESYTRSKRVSPTESKTQQ
jgi:putative nucleotidyltransferase with HDIG domain